MKKMTLQLEELESVNQLTTDWALIGTGAGIAFGGVLLAGFTT